MNRILIYILSVLISGCTLISGPETPELYNPKNILDDTINLLKGRYPFISFKKINPDSLHSFYLSKISSYDGDEIYKLLNDILYELKDGHVWFSNRSGHRISPYAPPRSIKDRYSFSLSVAREYLKENFNSIENGKIIYGTINNSIGYIFIQTFLLDGFNYKNFSNVINDLKSTNGLIIDVRSNGGGSDYAAYYMFSHFIREPFLNPTWLDHDGNESHHIYIQPAQNYYSNPVILLQNGTCFSATEGFISMMRELEQVTTLGDTTGGGSGAPIEFEISYKIKINLSTKAQLTYQGEFIEWNGIKPDILLPQSQDDIEAKRDIQLEVAVRILK